MNTDFDLRGLVSTVLAAGVTDSMLSMSGFNKQEYKSAFQSTVGSVVDVLGRGFLNAWLESLISGQGMNVDLAFALSLGRLVGRNVPAPDAEQVALKIRISHANEQAIEEMLSSELNAHRVKVPGQKAPTQTDSQGHARAIEDSVPEPSDEPVASPQKQQNMLLYYETMKSKSRFDSGNNRYSF